MRRPVRAFACSAVALALASLPTCRSVTGTGRKLGLPGGASRSADLALPLDDNGRALLLLYAVGFPPPEGDWSQLENGHALEHLDQVPRPTEMKFAPLLSQLQAGVPTAVDLEPRGRIGQLLDPPGAIEGALDARFQGSIEPGDVRAGVCAVEPEHPFYFVFYRRFPTLAVEGTPPRAGALDARCPGGAYCRLVVVSVRATARD